MTIQIINTGSGANSRDGDSIRSAFNKVNTNFLELTSYLSTLSTTATSLVIISGVPPQYPETGMLWYDDFSGRTYIYYDNSWVDTNPLIPVAGYAGSRGSSGFVGSRGAGFTGSQGIIGSRGDPGFVGSRGAGFTGSQGFTGSRGVIGFVGSQGIGFTGSQGFTGSTGTQGVIGNRGFQGYWGSIGYTGSTGYWGSAGYTGSASTMRGFVGSTGYTGSRAYTGSVGYTGSTGTQGEVGFTGSTGTQGEVGFTGSTGTQGEIGFTGSMGEPGTFGFTGSEGIGFTGSKGNNGYTGSGITGLVNEGEAGSFPVYLSTGSSLTPFIPLQYLPPSLTSPPIVRLGGNPVNIAFSPTFQIMRNGYTAAPTGGFAYIQFHNTPRAVTFNFLRSRGTSLVPLDLVAGDQIAHLQFGGQKGTVLGPRTGATFIVVVESTSTGNALASAMQFSTDTGNGIQLGAVLSSSSTWKIDKLGLLSTSTSTIIVSTDLSPDNAARSLGNTSSQWLNLYADTLTVNNRIKLTSPNDTSFLISSNNVFTTTNLVNIQQDVVVINATSSTINNENDPGLYISPIRNNGTTGNIIYYNTSTKELTYNTLIDSTTQAGPNPPATASTGTTWYDSTSGRLYIYFENTWVDASPPRGSGPTYKMVAPPTTSSSNGIPGQVSSDATYVYVCVDTNTWVRSAIVGSL